MEKGGRGQELLNLVATGKVLSGETNDWKFAGAIWSDAYIYNVMESICMALAVSPEGDTELARAQAHLRAKMEEWIPIILAAQDKDGYIHFLHVRQPEEPGWNGFHRRQRQHAFRHRHVRRALV